MILFYWAGGPVACFGRGAMLTKIGPKGLFCEHALDPRVLGAVHGCLRMVVLLNCVDAAVMTVF